MATNKDLEYGLLAELSYTDFRYDSLSKNNPSGWKESAIEDIIGDDDTRNELRSILSTYEIVDFKSTASGMQALLLKDSSGNYTVAYRGTQFELSWEGFLDTVVADVLGMGLKVVPKWQFKDALDVTSDWMGEYNLNASNTTVSGHSLGGALAQLNSYTFGFEAYTYNAFGFDAATSGMRTTATAMQSILEDTNYLNNAVKNTDNIHNFIAVGEHYQDAIAGGLSKIVDIMSNGHIGETTPIKTYDGGLIGSHRSVVLNDSIKIYHNIMDAAGITNYNYLTKLFDSYQEFEIESSQVIDVVQEMAQLLGESTNSSVQDTAQSIADNHANINLTSLVDKTAEQLVSDTKEGIYALINFNHFTIDGNLSAYDTINPGDYSEMYIKDRAYYLYYTMDKENRYDKTPALNYYEDTALGDAYTLDKGDWNNKVIFGSNSKDDTLEGDANSDHLYGNGGDDTLKGGEGNDYLEGGEGYDTYVIEGEGKNTIVEDFLENGTTVAGGKINFKGNILGKATDSDGDGIYTDAYNNSYTINGSDLTISSSDAETEARVKNYDEDNNSLGIYLEDGKPESEGKKETLEITKATAHSTYAVHHPDQSTAPSDSAALDFYRALYPNKVINYVGSNSYNLGGGDDDVKAKSGSDTIRTNDGNDTITTTDGNDYIDSGSGWDSVNAAGDNNTIIQPRAAA